MSLELVRETVKVNRIIGSESAQTVIDNDIIVPDVKPDIERIISIDGYVFASSSEACEGEVIVTGKVG